MKNLNLLYQKTSVLAYDALYYMPGDDEGNSSNEEPDADDKPVPDKD